MPVCVVSSHHLRLVVIVKRKDTYQYCTAAKNILVLRTVRDVSLPHSFHSEQQGSVRKQTMRLSCQQSYLWTLVMATVGVKNGNATAASRKNAIRPERRLQTYDMIQLYQPQTLVTDSVRAG